MTVTSNTDTIAAVLVLSGLGLLIAVRVLISIPASSRLLRRGCRRLWTGVCGWLNPPAAPDPEELEFRAAIRREELRRELHRVRQLLATDQEQPATRQRGNRLAYHWLIRELKRVDDVLAGYGYADCPVAGWDPALAGRSGRGAGAGPLRYAPRVEVLEFGPRS